MNHLKLLGLLAVAVTALLAFAGSAPAASVTSSAGTTPNIVATSTNVAFHGAFTTVECKHSVIEWNVESHGAGVPVGGSIDSLDFTECNHAVTMNNKGGFAIHAAATTGDGTVTWTGGNITIHTSVGICTFTSNGTDIGTLDGKTGAVIDIKSAKIPRTAGNFLCGSSGTWTGSYNVTSPHTLEIH